MTFSVNIKGKDCIVMAIDSREIYRRDGAYLLHHDQCKKLFVLPNHVCISISGDSGKVILDKNSKYVKYHFADINDLIYGLYFNPHIKQLTLRDVVEAIMKKFKYYQFANFRSYVHVGGIENGKLKNYYLKLENHGEQPKVTLRDDYGYFFQGGNIDDPNKAVEYVKRILQVDMSLDDDSLYQDYILPLRRRKLIQLAKGIIEDRIREHQKLPIEDQTIGGHVDVVLVTKYRSRWKRKGPKRVLPLSRL